MKLLTVIMVFLLLLLQYRLWTGNGSLVEVNLLKDEIEKLKIQMGDELFESRKFKLAISLFSDMVLKNEFDDFLTLPAYKHI